MAYRSGPCDFCSSGAAETCSRGAAAVCSAHAPATEAHCRICDNELQDDLDVVRFRHDVQLPDSLQVDFLTRQGQFTNTVRRLVHWISKGLEGRRVRRVFARRSHAAIAEWRRQAGIVLTRD